MDYRRFAALVRAVRQQKGWRQIDLAVRAGVSQASVSRIENAACDELTGRLLDAVARALNIRLFLDCSYQGARGDSLVDRAHARIVEAVVAMLSGTGWTVRVEFSFSEYGERGIVDALAWNEVCGALAIFEIKTSIGDLQRTVAALDVKHRLVPAIARRDLGWNVGHVAVVLVLPDGSGARESVARHSATFDAALPARTVGVRRWLRAPAGTLRGIWFLRDIPVATDNEKGRRRIRRRRPPAAE